MCRTGSRASESHLRADLRRSAASAGTAVDDAQRLTLRKYDVHEPEVRVHLQIARGDRHGNGAQAPSAAIHDQH